MLHINELTYRISRASPSSRASAAIPTGHKVGLVGRNGAGKLMLLRLISGEIHPEDGSITTSKNARIGHVAQEAPGGPETLIEWVLAADTERAGLIAEAETATDPHRIAEIQIRLSDMRAHAAPARAARSWPASASTRRRRAGRARASRAAGGCGSHSPPSCFSSPTCSAHERRTTWTSRAPCPAETYIESYPHTVLIVSHDRDLLNRAVEFDPASRAREAHPLDWPAATTSSRRRGGRSRASSSSSRRSRTTSGAGSRRSSIRSTPGESTRPCKAGRRAGVKALARMQPIAAQVEDRGGGVQPAQSGEGAGKPADPARGRDGRLRARQAHSHGGSTSGSTRTTASRFWVPTATASRRSPS